MANCQASQRYYFPHLEISREIKSVQQCYRVCVEVGRTLSYMCRPMMSIENKQKEVDAKFGQVFATGSESAKKRSRNA